MQYSTILKSVLKFRVFKYILRHNLGLIGVIRAFSYVKVEIFYTFIIENNNKKIISDNSIKI